MTYTLLNDHFKEVDYIFLINFQMKTSLDINPINFDFININDKRTRVSQDYQILWSINYHKRVYSINNFHNKFLVYNKNLDYLINNPINIPNISY